MSTEERDKAALEAFPANITYPMGVKRDHNAALRIAFTLGWDARGQVTPDEGAIAGILAIHWLESRGMSYGTPDRCVCGVTTSPLPGDEDVSVRRARAFAGHQAAAILALFNEKGNE